MTLQSAEKQVNQLLEYVKEIKSSDSTMYRKSKERLDRIASTCNQIVYLISEILEYELLTDNTDEFNGVHENIISYISSMEDSLSQLKSFIFDSNTMTANEEDDNSVLATYIDVFDIQSTSYISLSDDSAIKQLIYIVYLWLNTRFIKHSTGFKYSLNHISRWLINLVIMYGYHTNHDIDKFANKLIDWCHKLDTNYPYGVPYDIYVLERNADLYTKYLTIDALTLWDELIEYGASRLCTLSTNDGFISEDSIYQLCDKYSPNIISKYEKLST